MSLEIMIHSKVLILTTLILVESIYIILLRKL